MAFKIDPSSDLIDEFNLRKYKNEGNSLVDGTEYLSNVKQQVISFYLEPTKEQVYFKAFITTFSDTYTPNYSTNQVFGRTDPIHIYQNTTRNITLAFQVPAASEGEAFENLGRVQKIIQMLYPGYSSFDNALTLSEAPLVRIKIMNLLSNNQSFTTNKETNTETNNQEKKTLERKYTNYKSSAAPDKGTLGVITSCTVTHNLEDPSKGVFEKEENVVLPKVIDVNLSFTPFHEETIGRTVGSEGQQVDQNGIEKKNIFPYGVDLGSSGANNIQPAGKSATKAEALRRDAEEKRRKASSAQQDFDKVQAANKRASRRLIRKEKRGRITEQERNEQLANLTLEAIPAFQESATATREAREAEQAYQDFLK